jgi:peptidyl-prolyl cis-trans isomerase B (cyclophilin B)
MTAAVQAGVFNDTTFSRVLPGEYIQLGKQGARRMGEMQLGPGVELQVGW